MGPGTGKHPSTDALLKFFEYDHLPERLQGASRAFHQMAHDLVCRLNSSAEMTAGLRKLLEAKDCFVRAALD